MRRSITTTLCRLAFSPITHAVFLLAAAGGCQATGRQVASRVESGPAAVSIILDTDIGTDVDDAGALAMLHTLANRGEARILAVMSCNHSSWSAPAIDVINTYYGRPDVPVGSTRTGRDDEIWYHDAVPSFPHRLKTGNDAPEAVSLYRKILAEQPDGSVTIVAIGWLTNMADLLNSAADSHSALAGRELVAAKVRELVAMGGVWPNTLGQGDYNFTMDRKAANDVIRHWPGPVTFTGLGIDVMTGKRLVAEGSAENPVRSFYINFLKANKVSERSSWDQIAVLYAVRGLADHFSAVRDGRCVARDDRANEWLPGDHGAKHGYLVYRMPQAQLAAVIEELMTAPPTAGGSPTRDASAAASSGNP